MTIIKSLKPQGFFFSFTFLEDISPFRGATDTPVLDFWWRLLWVSKLGWSAGWHTFLPACKIHLWCDTCWLIEVSMAAKHIWSTYLQTCPQAISIGGSSGLERVIYTEPIIFPVENYLALTLFGPNSSYTFPFNLCSCTLELDSCRVLPGHTRYLTLCPIQKFWGKSNYKLTYYTLSFL